MEYDVAAAPKQISGRAFFTPTGESGEIDFGNILMHKLEFGVKRKERLKARRGQLVQTHNKAYQANPEFTLEGDEFTTPMLPIIFGGTANADVVQSAGTASTFAFTATKGRWFFCGAFKITNASLTTPGSKVEGVVGAPADYLIDRGLGRIYIPLGSSIANGASCVMTFDKPAITRDSINAMDQLNRAGSLRVLEEDSYSTEPRIEYIFPCNVNTDSPGDSKPEDYGKFQLKMTSTTGFFTVTGRQN
jgi:hypothetical protein